MTGLSFAPSTAPTAGDGVMLQRGKPRGSDPLHASHHLHFADRGVVVLHGKPCDRTRLATVDIRQGSNGQSPGQTPRSVMIGLDR